MVVPEEKIVYDIREARADRPRVCRVKDNTRERSKRAASGRQEMTCRNAAISRLDCVGGGFKGSRGRVKI
jgi:hypothetical protein